MSSSASSPEKAPAANGGAGGVVMNSPEDRPLKVQLVRSATREKAVVTLSSSAPLTALFTEISSKFSLSPSSFALYNDFPPRQVDSSQPHLSLSAIGIRQGDTLEVREKEKNESEQANGNGKTEMKEGKGPWEQISHIEATKGYFGRKEMPRDNSCLFHAIAYVCQNKVTGDAAAVQIRELAANIVAADQDRYNAIFLGMPNPSYQSMIMNSSSWGGGIELAIFARHFQVEIVAFDHLYLREDVFGSGGLYKKRVFLLYTGDHYDVLTWVPSGSAFSASSTSIPSNDQPIFANSDESAWARARDFVKFLHNEAVKKGECTKQNEWRNNPELGRRKGQKKTNANPAAAAAASSSSNSAAHEQNTFASAAAAAAGSASTPAAAAAPAPSGDSWSCGVCTLINKSSSRVCSACGAPSPLPAPAAAAASSRPSQQSAVQVPPDFPSTFECTRCTLRNAITRKDCSACGAANPYWDEIRPPQAAREERLIGPPTFDFLPQLGMGMGMDPGNSWTCSRCAFNNASFAVECGSCASAKYLSVAYDGPIASGYIPRPAPRDNAATATANVNATSQLQSSAASRTHSNAQYTALPALPSSGSGSSLSSSSPPAASAASASSAAASSSSAAGAQASSPAPKRGWFSSNTPQWTCSRCGEKQNAQLIRCKKCTYPNQALLYNSANTADPGCTLM